MIDMRDPLVYQGIVQAKGRLYQALEVLDAMEKKAVLSDDTWETLKPWLERAIESLAGLVDVADDANEKGVDMNPGR